MKYNKSGLYIYIYINGYLIVVFLYYKGMNENIIKININES